MSDLDFIERVRAFRPSEGYILTYGVDLPFYEHYFLPKIMRAGCRKNVLFVDDRQFHGSICDTPRTRGLGREYMLFPVRSAGVFHPKIYFFKRQQSGQTQTLCLVGSGNLTYPGLRQNRELFSEIEDDAKGEKSIVWKHIATYIESLLCALPGEGARLALNWFKSGLSEKFEPTTGDTDFLAYPSGEPIGKLFCDRIKGDVEELFVMSPFYDSQLFALEQLIKKLLPSRVSVLLQDKKVSLPKNKMIQLAQRVKGIRFFQLKENDGRYLHAKLIIASSAEQEHVLIGSANVTRPALLQSEQSGNHEACFYFRLPVGRAFELLSLSKKDISEISIESVTPRSEQMAAEEVDVSSSVHILSLLNIGGLYSVSVFSKMDLPHRQEFEFLTESRKVIKISFERVQTEQGGYCFRDQDHLLDQAIAGRCLDKVIAGSSWFPILRLNELKKNARLSDRKTDKLAEDYLSASSSDYKAYALQEVIDYMLGLSLALLDKKKTDGIRAKKSATDESEYKITTIENKPDAPENKENMNEDSFSDQFLKLLSLLGQTLPQEQVAIVDDPEEEPEDDAASSEADKSVYLDEQKEFSLDIGKISQNFLRHRRQFLKRSESALFPSGVLPALSYFVLVTLPQIPYLCRSYWWKAVGTNPSDTDFKEFEKHSCVETKDWEIFLFRSIDQLGRRLSKESLPEKNYSEDEISEVLTGALIYCIATVYPFLKKGIGLPFEGPVDYAVNSAKISALWYYLLRLPDPNAHKKLDRIFEHVEAHQAQFPCDLKNIGDGIDLVMKDIRLICSNQSGASIRIGPIHLCLEKGKEAQYVVQNKYRKLF